MRKIFIAAILLSSTVLFAQKDASVSFEKWISLKTYGSPVISPDGKIIVYGVSGTDWANNSYDNELWMVKDGEVPVQLTRTNKNSSGNAAFTPDGKYVSFVADRGDKRQIYIISVAGGEAIQVTKDEDGINSYAWNPDGTKIVYSKTQPESKKDKTKKERFGAFGIEGEEYQLTHLWI
jgi:dipeptidyl aminopeptidase/acylaminoacyl peptidase